MRIFYTVLLYLLLPFLILRMLLKARRLPSYGNRLSERFCLNKRPEQGVDVWIHAVSLGEVVAATPLIELFLQNKSRVLVTTITPTGSGQVMKQFGQRVYHQYLPYDYPWALCRFFKRYKPSKGIIIETELWPNLISAAKCFGLSLFIANARISGRAFKQYEWIKWFLKPQLSQFNGIFAQSELDAERFVALGAPSSIVKMLGNIKFDIEIKQPEQKEVEALPLAWGASRPVIIAASTHVGEEEAILKSFMRLKHAIPAALLLIAPRHPERFNEVYTLSISLGYKTARRTEHEHLSELTEVFIIDSLGELLSFYKLSDYAAVCGSFIPVGGHNVLEPIALGVPVLCGPFMQNSQAVCDTLIAAGAIKQIQDADELMDCIIQLYSDPVVVRSQVEQAYSVLTNNRGVVLNTFNEITQHANSFVK